MKKIFTKIYEWVVYSSVNSKQISLTLKGALPFLAFFGLDAVTSDVDGSIEAFTQLIATVGEIVTLFISGYGLLRKIWVGLQNVYVVLKKRFA